MSLKPFVRIFIMILALLLTMTAFTVVAQDDTPTPEPTFTAVPTAEVTVEPLPEEPPIEEPVDESDYITPIGALDILRNAVLAIVAAGFGGAPVVIFFTSVGKRLLPGIDAGLIQLSLGVLANVIYWIATYFSQGPMILELFDLLANFGPALLNFLGVLGLSTAGYKLLRNADVPFVGYARTDPRPQAEAISTWGGPGVPGPDLNFK